MSPAPIQYTGNAIPAPAFVAGAVTADDEILFSTVGYIQKGVTLKPGQGVLPGGTALIQDPASKQYIKATTGSTAEGILRKTTDTGADAQAQVFLANILYAGTLKLAAVSTANSAITGGYASILGAQVNAVQGFFRF
jgi:hypothetical protein